MNMTKKTARLMISLVLGSGLFAAHAVQASADESAQTTDDTPVIIQGAIFQPSDNALTDLNTALESARQNNRLLLVVMGANWCHDSRSLAARLDRPPLSAVIDRHYETLFVDVGYLQKGKDVITSLGLPVYYATPTVLIVDPVSGQLVNAQNRHQWGSAAGISMDASVEYFEQMASMDLATLAPEKEPTGELHRLLADIDAFEQKQADRLYAAYAVLSPMLEAYKTGDKDKFSEKDWNKVRDFRSALPGDIDALRAEAYRRVAAGDRKIKLKYPKYRAFRWEKKKKHR